MNNYYSRQEVCDLIDKKLLKDIEKFQGRFLNQQVIHQIQTVIEGVLVECLMKGYIDEIPDVIVDLDKNLELNITTSPQLVNCCLLVKKDFWNL